MNWSCDSPSLRVSNEMVLITGVLPPAASPGASAVLRPIASRLLVTCGGRMEHRDAGRPVVQRRPAPSHAAEAARQNLRGMGGDVILADLGGRADRLQERPDIVRRGSV